MKRINICAVGTSAAAALVLTTAAPATGFGQEAPSPPPEAVRDPGATRSWGVGLSLGSSAPLLSAAAATYGAGTDLGSGASPFAVFSAPLFVASDLRLEPYVGGAYRSVETKELNTVDKASATAVVAGTGIYYTRAAYKDLSVFGGGVLGLVIVRQEESSTTSGATPSETDSSSEFTGYRVGAKFGFEYHVTKALSVGAEASANYLYMPDVTSESSDTEQEAEQAPGDVSISSFYTQSQFTLRWYL